MLTAKQEAWRGLNNVQKVITSAEIKTEGSSNIPPSEQTAETIKEECLYLQRQIENMKRRGKLETQNLRLKAINSSKELQVSKVRISQ